MKIFLGSARAAKIAAVQASVNRIATMDITCGEAEIVAQDVVTDAPSMPMMDEEMMYGAKVRAKAMQKLGKEGDLYIGLEGGFHSMEFDSKKYTFLRGWAYVTDGTLESYGTSPSISVPDMIVNSVITEKSELGEIIDRVAGEKDVRSRQGTWGILSLDLLTRSMSFEMALIAAFAPFYNKRLYTDIK